MSTRYKFSAEEIAEIQEARRKNTDKRVERRLKAIEMRALGQSLEDVGHACEYHPSYITTLVAKYRDGGLTAIVSVILLTRYLPRLYTVLLRVLGSLNVLIRN